MRARDLLVPLAFAGLTGLAWPWWSGLAAPAAAHLPHGLALAAVYAAWRLALSPLHALVAAASPKPSSRTHP